MSITLTYRGESCIPVELERLVIKSGRIMIENGELRDPFVGKTLHIAPDYDRDVEADIQELFETYYSVS